MGEIKPLSRNQKEVFLYLYVTDLLLYCHPSVILTEYTKHNITHGTSLDKFANTELRGGSLKPTPIWKRIMGTKRNRNEVTVH